MVDRILTEFQRQSDRARKKEILARFKNQQESLDHPLGKKLAGVAYDVIKKYGPDACFLNSARIAQSILDPKKKILTSEYRVHYWSMPEHTVVAVVDEIKKELIFVDSIGLSTRGLEPDITILRPDSQHPVFGNPDIDQQISPPLTYGDSRLKKIAFPELTDPHIRRLADFFSA